MNSQPIRDKSPSILPWLFFTGTLAMSYLTVAKELVLYQNNTQGWTVFIYKIATRHYYPLLAINFIALLSLLFYEVRCRRFSLILTATCLLFAANVLIFSSNNVLNFLEGKPLHRRHQGIGW